MSVDSYFFASFQDGDRAIHAIQRILDERPTSCLPRVSSNLSLQAAQAESSAEATRRAHEAEHGAGPLGIRKLGSVLKPLVSRAAGDKGDESDKERTSEDNKSGFVIPFLNRHKPSHDSLETLRVEPSESQSQSSGPYDEEFDGYPPRQSGVPPAGMMMGEDGKPGWGAWIKKPATKIFGASPSSSSLLSRSPGGSLLDKSPDHSRYKYHGTPTKRRTDRRNTRESVTEVVEPTIAHDHDMSEDEEESGGGSGGSGQDMGTRGARMSWTSEGSIISGSGQIRSEYSVMERSESANRESVEMANKFRAVFSLSEKEELIDRGWLFLLFCLGIDGCFSDFPGYLYRVLPVSGRFFVSSNYFCFRSSQLLYKTKVSIFVIKGRRWDT